METTQNLTARKLRTVGTAAKFEENLTTVNTAGGELVTALAQIIGYCFLDYHTSGAEGADRWAAANRARAMLRLRPRDAKAFERGVRGIKSAAPGSGSAKDAALAYANDWLAEELGRETEASKARSEKAKATREQKAKDAEREREEELRAAVKTATDRVTKKHEKQLAAMREALDQLGDHVLKGAGDGEVTTLTAAEYEALYRHLMAMRLEAQGVREAA